MPTAKARANATTRAIIERGLALLGYEVGCPPQYRSAAALDEAVARRSPCSECDHLGLSLVYYHHGDTVLPLTCCPACGYMAAF
jgi:hypothetical protein